MVAKSASRMFRIRCRSFTGIRMKILFLNQFFTPSVNSSATLPYDAARYLVGQGFAVDALVGYPKEYNMGLAVPLRESVSGISVRRLRYLQLKRSGKIGRLINYFSFTAAVLLHLHLLKHYDCVVVFSNPPILPLAAVLARRLYGTPFLFVAYDVYPEVAYPSGSIRPGSAVDRVMKRINRSLYAGASGVVALTEEMRQFLLASRPELSQDRVRVIHNWAFEEERYTTDRAADDGEFLVTYFGNMGICQEMDTLMDAAALLRDDRRIRFLFVGFGTKEAALEERARREKLERVRFEGHLTGKRFTDAVSGSGCTVITLAEGLRGTCAPSKYYSSLCLGRPILSITEPGSYLPAEIEREGIGFGTRIGDAETLRDHILWLAEHPEECDAIGERARALYRRKYAREKSLSAYAQWLRELK